MAIETVTPRSTTFFKFPRAKVILLVFDEVTTLVRVIMVPETATLQPLEQVKVRPWICYSSGTTIVMMVDVCIEFSVMTWNVYWTFSAPAWLEEGVTTEVTVPGVVVRLKAAPLVRLSTK